ncbi:MAG: hypothetical protein WBY53_04990 [Acidobacteriaceae bacterium]
MERMLANPFFSHSRRFPSFLRYVVNATFNGHAEDLKERTLGVEIFGKSSDYDTAADPIVRVTAAEIRKRIAQYYQDPDHEQELRISLPSGSYVPQFQLRPAVITIQETHEEASIGAAAATSKPHSRARGASYRLRWVLALILIILALGGIYSFHAWRRAQRSAFAEFWDPFLSSGDPVLFCVADQTHYTDLTLRDADDPARQVTLQDNLTAVVIDDLDTITKIAGVLQAAGKRYTLRGEGSTSLMDLRNGPSVIIGAFDNAWALRMLRPLRYHFANNPDMSVFSIIDSTKPGQTRWSVNRKQQIATNNYRDYAIVARFTDGTTGKPTLIAAGIGRGGTIAAGEFLTSRDLLQAVRNQRPSPNTKNIEVVLSTQIIGGEPGTPKIEAVYFW